MNNTSTPPFACPVHKTPLSENFFCPLCKKFYPQVNGVPILINNENSIFSTADYLAESTYGGASSYGGSLDNSTGLKKLYRQFVYRLRETPFQRSFSAQDSVEMILSHLPEAKILMIGSGETSLEGNITYTDVAFGKHVQCIADAHDLPFLDDSFDACIAVAVLEHVVDPYRCVNEVMRVLKQDGYVYAETPFMQPVHMGAYDFTRFSYMGHRRLFRYFKEIRSGIAVGAWTGAGQMLCSAIVSLSDNPTMKKYLRLLGLILTYPLRWLDYLSNNKRSAYDAASSFYFFGQIRSQPISDYELLRMFRGS